MMMCRIVLLLLYLTNIGAEYCHSYYNRGCHPYNSFDDNVDITAFYFSSNDPEEFWNDFSDVVRYSLPKELARTFNKTPVAQFALSELLGDGTRGPAFRWNIVAESKFEDDGDVSVWFMLRQMSNVIRPLFQQAITENGGENMAREYEYDYVRDCYVLAWAKASKYHNPPAYTLRTEIRFLLDVGHSNLRRFIGIMPSAGSIELKKYETIITLAGIDDAGRSTDQTFYYRGMPLFGLAVPFGDALSYHRKNLFLKSYNCIKDFSRGVGDKFRTSMLFMDTVFAIADITVGNGADTYDQIGSNAMFSFIDPTLDFCQATATEKPDARCETTDRFMQYDATVKKTVYDVKGAFFETAVAFSLPILEKNVHDLTSYKYFTLVNFREQDVKGYYLVDAYIKTGSEISIFEVAAAYFGDLTTLLRNPYRMHDEESFKILVSHRGYNIDVTTYASIFDKFGMNVSFSTAVYSNGECPYRNEDRQCCKARTTYMKTQGMISDKVLPSGSIEHEASGFYMDAKDRCVESQEVHIIAQVPGVIYDNNEREQYILASFMPMNDTVVLATDGWRGFKYPSLQSLHNVFPSDARHRGRMLTRVCRCIFASSVSILLYYILIYSILFYDCVA